MKGYQTHTQTGILLNANEASQNVDDNVKQEILDAISNLALNRCSILMDLIGKWIGSNVGIFDSVLCTRK